MFDVGDKVVYPHHGAGTVVSKDVKLVLGEGESLVGSLLVFDAMNMDFTKVKIRWDPSCPVNGENPTITEPIDYDQFCGIVPPAEVRAAEAVR